MRVFKGLVVALAVCAIGSIGMFGCNTFKGAGKDIQQGGRAVENAADNADHSGVRQHSILASADSGGSISPVGTTNVTYGSDRTYLVKANSGYRVSNVLVDGKSLGAVHRHTFDNVTTNHTISAEFVSNSSR